MSAKIEVIKLGIFFLFLFTSFTSFMTILTHIYRQLNLDNFGPATLASNYTAFIISTFVAPLVTLPIKAQFLIASVCYTINFSSGIFVSMIDTVWIKYFISCVGAGIAGFSAGFLWVSQGRYIHIICEKYNLASIRGQLYGIFMSIYTLSNITAGIISTFGLGFFDAQTYFYIIVSLGIMSTIFCALFITSPQKNISEQNRQKTSLIERQSYQIKKQEESYTLRDKFNQIIKFFPKMTMLLLILVIDGVCLGFYSSQVIELLPQDDRKDNILAGSITIVLGIGSLVGGYMCGKIVDIKGTLYAGNVGILFITISCINFVFAIYFSSVAMAFISSFLWGLSLFYIQGWMFCVCSKHFGGRNQAFSYNKIFHSLFYLLFQIALIPTHNQIPLTPICISIVILGLISFFMIKKVPKNYETANETINYQ